MENSRVNRERWVPGLALAPSYKPPFPSQALELGFKGRWVSACTCFCDVGVTHSVLLCRAVFLLTVLEVYDLEHHSPNASFVYSASWTTIPCTQCVSYRCEVFSQSHSLSLQPHHMTVCPFHLKHVPCWPSSLTACISWKRSRGRSITLPGQEVFSFKVFIQFCLPQPSLPPTFRSWSPTNISGRGSLLLEIGPGAESEPSDQICMAGGIWCPLKNWKSKEGYPRLSQSQAWERGLQTAMYLKIPENRNVVCE